ncbi:haloacid dehalogenase, type II [Cyphellophora europaea CBS 101466]|uniref:Haloacid dehalogenase, type II n=1 Tax=Cyphellophora europaea (strain CBS 101466) TaxID=1220924 RepID=W2RJV9_CYPE1|nr:haloacid dehalogenase, type II [Cyphellophora europaea CBS 101466]ETN36630.1 haloacid dehalogenase, type II [Cyphellophora europaea CBS 101466]
MSQPRKHVVWDIVGTVVSYQVGWDAINARLGDKLRAHNIDPYFFGFAWNEVAEREYTYLSMSGKYARYYDCVRGLFYRVLGQAGIEKPREFASDDDLEYILSQYRELKARPGAAECWQKLRDAGFTMWAFTAGDAARVQGYLEKNGIPCPEENFRSCDTLGIGKPAPECYKPLLEEFQKNGDEAWFAAAHQWDVSAAKRSGFKGAYVTVLEKEACNELFGELDVQADDFITLADRIIEASKAG